MNNTQTETLFTWVTCNGSECAEALETINDPEQLRANLEYGFSDRGWDLAAQGFDLDESFAWLLGSECRSMIVDYIAEAA